MSLYFVRHQHDAEICPASDPNMGAMLLSHMDSQNARQFGVEIHADAVLDGRHTFVLIVGSDSVENIERFMQPFSQAGPVEIMPASTCEVVVDRAGC